MYPALLGALPGVQVTSVPNLFDGIAELAAGSYSTVLAAAEPIERRPEAAVRVLREVAGECRVILFGHPTLELLSRKMLQFGCDDYVVTPASSGELRQMLGATSLRLASEDGVAESGPDVEQDSTTGLTSSLAALEKLPLADLLLDALLQHPHDAPSAAVREISSRIGSAMLLRHTAAGVSAPEPLEGGQVISHELHGGGGGGGALHLLIPDSEDAAAARHALAQLAFLFGKLFGLQDRHNRLQKLAITDELTNLYNARYFRHFLSRIIEKGRALRFPVTLLLFDIDDFKKYNDRFGHGVGDEILVQTATLMRRCCRDHDLVARIGGDEFAVVFWEKEGPRQPRDPKAHGSSRPPQTPLQIFERFKRLMSAAEFTGLGSTGRGTLGISAGLAVFPYDANDAAGLIKAADEFLMFGAKQGGKNSIHLVSGEETPPSRESEK
jgi:GGDEF domain-containing protein